MAVQAEVAAMVAAVTNSVHNNFFPDTLADQLFKYVNDIKWTYGWKSHAGADYAHWNFDIAGGTAYNGLDVADRLRGPVQDAWNFIKDTHLTNHTLIRCYANAHTYGVEGYPHTDSRRDHDTTVVVYMNKNWKRQWGGETVIFNDDDIELAAMPKFNRALIFNGNQWHCARGVTRICPDQRRTIMFKCAVTNADPQRDKLQRFLNDIGASVKSHKYGSLAGHLLNTYDLLKAAGQPDHVCLAGGAHSVFGTNAYTDRCLEETDVRVEQAIGQRALNLVKLFKYANRPVVLEQSIGKHIHAFSLDDNGTKVVLPEEFDALCMIEAANLQDQNELDRYPMLKAEWLKVSKSDKYIKPLE
jgi:hypothetical protein